jgi:hypothetical protein
MQANRVPKQVVMDARKVVKTAEMPKNLQAEIDKHIAQIEKDAKKLELYEVPHSAGIAKRMLEGNYAENISEELSGYHGSGFH